MAIVSGGSTITYSTQTKVNEHHAALVEGTSYPACLESPKCLSLLSEK